MKKLLLLFCTALLLINSSIQAQLAQTDSSILYVTGEGLFINLGKGEGTKINVLSTVQPGVQYNRFDSANNATNSNRLSLNLVRLSLTATTFKNKVSVGIVTDFTGQSPILEGWVGYAISKHAKLVLGQKQTHTNNRLAMADERYAQVMSQSIAGKSNDGIIYGGLMQNFVGSSREGGLFIETNFNINKMKVYPSASITTGEGQNFFNPQTNLGFKYGGRLDILPMGDFIKNNAFIAHDIYRERKPKLAIGIAASYNVKASSPIGSDNAVIAGIYNKAGTADFANYRKLVADFIFKSNGFALVGEYVNGTVSGTDLYTNTAATNKLTEQVASAYYNLGSAFNVQSSYVFTSGWAVDGRYAQVTPEYNIAGSTVHKQTWLTFGIIKNNAVKVGINTSFIDDSTPTVTTKRWVNNFAIQILL
jgi:hypothetical protein